MIHLYLPFSKGTDTDLRTRMLYTSLYCMALGCISQILLFVEIEDLLLALPEDAWHFLAMKCL